MSDDEKVLFKFHPKAEGDFITGIPARDLTEADLLNLSPTIIREITAVPEGAHRMYQPVKGAKLKAEYRTAEIPVEDVISTTPAEPVQPADNAEKEG